MNIIDYLKAQPKSRERKNKNRAIGNMIQMKYLVDIEKAKLADIVGEVLTLDRAWRKALEENPDLRGSDYKEKEILSQQKQIDLGYEVGYNLKLNI